MKDHIISLIRKTIFKLYGERLLNIGNLKLIVDFADAGGRQYASLSYPYKELNNPLNIEILRSINPHLIIDIGANYGFTGIVFASHFSQSNIILVEPSRKLCSYIKRNFEINKFSNYEILRYICGAEDIINSSISLHPSNSLDNRVSNIKGWKRENVPTTTLNQILENHFCIFVVEPR